MLIHKQVPISIPVDQNGNPLIPVPAGFVKQTAQTQQPSTPDPNQNVSTGTAQQQQQDSGGSDDDGPPTVSKSPMDIKVEGIYGTPEFQEINSLLDTRTGFEKFGDAVKGIATSLPVSQLLGIDKDTTSLE